MPNDLTSTMTDLVHKIYQSALIHKTRTAFEINGTSFSYEKFFSLVTAYREQIEKYPGENVAVLATQNIETYAVIIASLFEGRAFIPLNPKFPTDRNNDILTVSGAKLLFIPTLSRIACEKLVRPGYEILEELGGSREPLRPPKTVEDSAIAYLFFTSGSTGRSKGVTVQRRALNHFIQALEKIPNFHSSFEDRYLQMFDLTFDLSNFGYLYPLALGAAVYPVSGEKKAFLEVSEVLIKNEISIALMVPSTLTFLAPYLGEFHAPHLRASLFCGEALDATVTEKWLHSVPNARVWNVYGPTEATIFCSFYEIPRFEKPLAKSGVVSIGKPMHGTDFYLLDQNDKLIEEKGVGELCLAGGQLASGYWKDPERTEQAFFRLGQGVNQKTVYRTGDLVERVGENYQFIGRADFQVKIDGYRVELGEIEYHAKNFHPFENVVVVPFQSNGFTRLYLYYQSQSALSADQQGALLSYLASKLPPYMVPSKVIWKREFPLNSNQKTDRVRLHEA